jgi:two-component system chemotaxis response regulator CheB
MLVVGASAGGVEALRILVAGLPADLPAVVLVVLHQPAGGHSALARILARAGPLTASHAVHGQAMKVAHLTIAPPDQHLLVQQDTTVLSHGPPEHRHRPAVDPLFRSAARWHGSRVIGVVLSGGLTTVLKGLRPSGCAAASSWFRIRTTPLIRACLELRWPRSRTHRPLRSSRSATSWPGW